MICEAKTSIKEFIDFYSFKDSEEVYTNGSELIQVFRVKQMLDMYVPKWIPCSERLPECEWGAETEALMYQVNDSIYTGYFGRGGYVRDSYFRGYADTTEGIDAADVIAWMPLPAPFKESED
jgi:hypothetical protein